MPFELWPARLIHIGEAASSLCLHLSKLVTFQQFGALTPDIALKGLSPARR
jgi:hypothetical protein